MIGHLRRLGIIRKLSGLTQAQLANKLGISQPTVARLEKDLESASLKQTEDWLRACGFPSAPSTRYLKELNALLPPQPIHSFLVALDEMARATGTKPYAHAKPTVVVIPNTQDDHGASIRLLRNLLDTGGSSFHGLLLPQRGLTLVFKHVSERPSALEDTVYLFRGSLQKEMLPSPVDYLDTTSEPYEEKRLPIETLQSSGPMTILEEPSGRQTGVVYLEHPLLRFVDIVRPGMTSEDQYQTYFEMDLIADADLLIYCCGATRISSPALLISACLATRADVFVAHPTGVDPSHFLKTIENAGRKILGRMLLDDDHGLKRNNSVVLEAFVASVKRLDDESCAERRWALTSGSDLRVHKRQRLPISNSLRTGTVLGEIIVARLLSGQTDEENGDVYAGADMMRALERFTRGEVTWNVPLKESPSRQRDIDRTGVAARRLRYEAASARLIDLAHICWKEVPCMSNL